VVPKSSCLAHASGDKDDLVGDRFEQEVAQNEQSGPSSLHTPWQQVKRCGIIETDCSALLQPAVRNYPNGRRPLALPLNPFPLAILW
jgi:hypothetical protein